MTDNSMTVFSTCTERWGTAKMVAFLETLEATASVTAAAKTAGMSREACYQQRRRDLRFADAWSAALARATQRLADDLFERAVEGETTPIFFKGEQIGERVRHDNRLAMWLLRVHDPKRYGRAADIMGDYRKDPMAVAAQTLAVKTYAITNGEK